MGAQALARLHLSGISGRIRSQQMYAVMCLMPALMIVNLVNSLSLLLVLYTTSQLSVGIILWVIVIGSVSLHTLYHNVRRRTEAQPRTVSQRSLNRVYRSAAVFGVIWIYPSLIVLPSVVGEAQVFTAALITGMICGGAIALYPLPRAAMIYSGLVTIGALMGLAIAGSLAVIGLIIIAASFYYICSKVIERHAQLFVAEFVTRLDLEESHKSVARLKAAGKPLKAGKGAV